MEAGISELATQPPHLHDWPDRAAYQLWGLAWHQSGSGIVEQAIRLGVDPLEHAVTHYLEPDQYSAHYVIGYEGHIVQVVNELKRAEHIGFMPSDRELFLSGQWTSHLPTPLVERWRAQWPNYQSPAHLFPGTSPNSVYIGAELLPLPDDSSAVGTEPMQPGMIFTLAQHQAALMLAKDIAARWNFPVGWAKTGRMATHEAVNPLQRTTKNPPAGWDPGALRAQPWFDLDWLRQQLCENTDEDPT